MAAASTSFIRRVLVVEDEPLMRSLLAQSLQIAGFETKTAADALSARKLTKTFDPDVLLVDIDLGSGPNGLELVAALSREDSGRGFVFLSHFAPSARELPQGLNISYVNKAEAASPAMVVEAVESALRGVGRGTESLNIQGPALTAAQVEVLRLVAEGLSNAEIAAVRGTSLRGVEQLLSRTYAALGLDTLGGKRARVQASQYFAKSQHRFKAGAKA